ncbi:MAG: hypothetical protein EBU90_13155 [Proteobacteria bacterium]|nr:hypothetical protein [Pseudomonadota bacterium]NBP15740.1 hypothetical protein [bacterium]
MKNSIILFTLLASTTDYTFAAYNTRDAAVERLTSHTGFRKSLKNGIFYTALLTVPVVIGATSLAQEKVTAFFVSITGCGILYGLLSAIRSGHVYVARFYFRKLYNKRIDYNNNLVKAFTVGAEYLPYALNDQEFIQYGLAAGFSLSELAHLARKSGRVQLADQL